MNEPSQLLNRARRQRARTAPDPRGFRPPAPAPAPAGISAGPAPTMPVVPAMPVTPAVPAPPEPPAGAVSPPAAPAPQRPAPRRGHALYSEIMKSHDRMGTRHL